MYTSLASSTPAPEFTGRRAHLLAVIQDEPGPVTTALAARINAAGGYGANRNTARLDLRQLVRAGKLIRIRPCPSAQALYVRASRKSAPAPGRPDLDASLRAGFEPPITWGEPPARLRPVTTTPSGGVL